MDKSLFNQASRWIWSDEANQTQNLYVAFRRTIETTGPVDTATLRITADTRYELFVNGEWVGHGPIRSWPSPWPVDTYDIGHLLDDGANTIAVLVSHYGIGTFQYIHKEPGLIMQIEWADGAGAHVVGTDDQWRAARHEGFEQATPRISCQQGWEEQFDARQAPGGQWRENGFDDSGWAQATVLRDAGESPHELFEARDIPFLSREALAPVRITGSDIVMPAPYTWSVNARPHLNSSDLTANMLIGAMLLATYIYSESAQTIEIHVPHLTRFGIKVGGVEALFDDMSLQVTELGVARANLKAGWNLMLVRMPMVAHAWSFWANFWSETPIKFAASPHDAASSPWRVLGPFETPSELDDVGPFNTSIFVRAERILPGATLSRFNAIWESATLDADDLSADWSRPIAAGLVAVNDVYALCASERVIEKAVPRIENQDAILGQTAEWAVIQPSTEGDVRVLVDFGREVVGFQEFEVDAQEGAVLDFHNFEFIQHDGRINLAEGMNNSFRYVCRDGYQTYRTFVRRGFRYTWISIRNFDSPLKLRGVRVIMSTYPPAAEGDFSCSDAMLTKIWQVGAHSVRCCSEDTYTDCPTYEQTHWVGDARNEALVDLVANGDPRLSRHCWIQVARSLDRSPIVESQTPSGWENILPAWSFLWMRWAHEHYVMTGDLDFGLQALDFLDRNVDGIEQHLDERGLFYMHAWNMFDWAPMDTPCNGIVTHLMCLAVQGLNEAAKLASLLGNQPYHDRWSELAGRISKSVNDHLWSQERQAYVDCIRPDGQLSPVFSQQTQTAAFISGVASGDRARRCREVIEKAPEGFVTAGSPFFMFFVLEVFAQELRFDLMQETMRSYWGPQIEAGATTFWEMYQPDAPRLTRSHCHGWSAAPTFFLSKYILGVQPLSPGYEKILISPQPADLRWAHGRVPTPHGVVEVYWTRSEKEFELRIDTPPGINTEIALPLSGKVRILEGAPRIVSESPVALESTGGCVRVVVM